ncbi:MAG: preprotein translocase subunit SecE [Oscillospiraceae bacterium]|jgi:preprotein translocase subunit SecE|nr:preprotein translocase subunit SecE [Oscillospiraceae bacterium]
MAKEEKSLTEKKAKPSGIGRFLRGIANIPKRMWNAILNTVAELKKVTWPSRKDLMNYTAIVLAFMVLMAVVVGLLDLGASRLISLIIRRA